MPLHFNFARASESGGNFDMRRIFEGTLVDARPERAVTFVDNHDTQPGQALQSWVQGWFKPLAYALILLRQGGVPCVFYGDYYGVPHDGIDPVGPQLETMLRLRRDVALGEQTDYLDDFNIIGWTRAGERNAPGSGCAVLLSDGPGGAEGDVHGRAVCGRSVYRPAGQLPGGSHAGRKRLWHLPGQWRLCQRVGRQRPVTRGRDHKKNRPLCSSTGAGLFLPPPGRFWGRHGAPCKRGRAPASRCWPGRGYRENKKEMVR